jgi:hypothetical protein
MRSLERRRMRSFDFGEENWNVEPGILERPKNLVDAAKKGFHYVAYARRRRQGITTSAVLTAREKNIKAET